jgi:hypothetical protein
LQPTLGFEVRQRGAGDLVERHGAEVLGKVPQAVGITQRGAALDGGQVLSDKLLLGLGIGAPWLLAPGDGVKLA